MNLNKAAAETPRQIVQRCVYLENQSDPESLENCWEFLKASQAVVREEYDPTPITDEWLRANGGEKIVSHWRFGNDSLLLQRCREVDGVWFTNRTTFDITTIGELRTLLRLCGETQGEAK